MHDNTIPRLAGWSEKPDEYETRVTWEWRHFREVQKGEKPKAIVLWEVPTKKEIQEHRTDGSVVTRYEPDVRVVEVPVYEIGQTKAVKAGPRRLAVREMWDIFVRHSHPDFYIWMSSDWLTCNGKLRIDHLLDHIGQRDIYGVRGNGRCTRYAGIDLDLHNGDVGVFTEQLRILLDTFHGRDGWHYQVADQNAGGVHLIRVLPKRISEAKVRKWLRDILHRLDQEHPDLARRASEAGMKSFGKMEVFPNRQAGLRLPLCRGRTMLLDRPLAKTQYRRKNVVDIEKYISWVNQPNAYMPKANVLEYVLARLRVPGPKVTATESPPPRIDSNQAKNKPQRAVADKVALIRGRYARTLHEFWTGESNAPDSLNTAIRLTALMAPYYYKDRQAAATAIEHLIDALPDTTFSDRLSSGDRAAVSRQVCDKVAQAFDECGDQPDPDSSRTILDATYDKWSARGYNPFDPTTWKATEGSMKMAPDFTWTTDEARLLEGLRAILKADHQKVSSFVTHLVRLVAGHDGQISINFIRKLMVQYGIPAGSGRDNKANKVMHRLIELGWVYIRWQHRWHPRQADKSQSSGQARTYGVGEALKYKFEAVNSSNLDTDPHMHLLLRHHPWHETFSSDELHELATEYARLKAHDDGVERLSEDEQRALAMSLAC